MKAGVRAGAFDAKINGPLLCLYLMRHKHLLGNIKVTTSNRIWRYISNWPRTPKQIHLGFCKLFRNTASELWKPGLSGPSKNWLAPSGLLRFIYFLH